MAVAAAARSTACTRRAESGRRGAAGFTLIEVLVVVIVVGLGAALITLRLSNDNGAALRQESERLRSTLEYAAQLAQWRREPLAWEGDADGYRFSRADENGEWREIADPELARHLFPSTMHLRAIGPAGTPAPLRVLLRASGRNDPYALLLDTAGGSWIIRADPLNRVVAGPAS